MATQIHMPQWGMAMTEGRIVRWLKKEGDSVKKGEPLFEVETEKITNTAESVSDGVLFKIIIAEGDTASVGTVIGIIAAEGETPDIDDISSGNEIGEPIDEKLPLDEQSRVPVQEVFVVATPAARRRSKELGIRLELVKGTGQDGRVTETDVESFHQQEGAQPAMTSVAKKMVEQSGMDVSNITGTGTQGKITKADIEKDVTLEKTSSKDISSKVSSIPYNGMRKSIGDTMSSSLANAAQLTGFTEVDVTEMVNFKEMMRKEYEKDESFRISYNDIAILAVSRALKNHPIMNSTHMGDEILLHDSVNMGIAVATPDGLMVPVLQNAHQKGLLQIAREARELAGKARAGTLNFDDVSNGTFTISNTSMIEVDGFTPILRPPETGILGIGRVKQKPAEHNGEIALRWMSVLSLTYNHCVVDGAPAHSFLANVGRYLQNPYLIMS